MKGVKVWMAVSEQSQDGQHKQIKKPRLLCLPKTCRAQERFKTSRWCRWKEENPYSSVSETGIALLISQQWIWSTSGWCPGSTLSLQFCLACLLVTWGLWCQAADTCDLGCGGPSYSSHSVLGSQTERQGNSEGVTEQTTWHQVSFSVHHILQFNW